VDEIKTSLDQQDKFRRKKQGIETKDLSRRKTNKHNNLQMMK
jgi:hypothetical protein